MVSAATSFERPVLPRRRTIDLPLGTEDDVDSESLPDTPVQFYSRSESSSNKVATYDDPNDAYAGTLVSTNV